MFFVCKPGREAISTSESAACSARQGQLDWPRAQERRIARYAPQSGRHRHRACAVFEGVLGRRVVLCHVTPTRVQRQSTCAPRALKSMVVFLCEIVWDTKTFAAPCLTECVRLQRRTTSFARREEFRISGHRPHRHTRAAHPLRLGIYRLGSWLYLQLFEGGESKMANPKTTLYVGACGDAHHFLSPTPA